MWVLTNSLSTEVPKLKCNQEEGNTRLVLHTKHARDGGIQNVYVVSEDKNVIALLLAIVFQ